MHRQHIRPKGRIRTNSILFPPQCNNTIQFRFQILDPPRNQISSTTAIHLFQDTELDNRLRDLVDIDGLLGDLHPVGESGRDLQRRAEQHRASGWVWYALHYCNAWLATPDCRMGWVNLWHAGAHGDRLADAKERRPARAG